MDQVVAGSAWARHELKSKLNPTASPYGWIPDWIGDMDAQEVLKRITACLMLANGGEL